MSDMAGTEWGTDFWGDIRSEPTEEQARRVSEPYDGVKLYSRAPMGQWQEESQ